MARGRKSVDSMVELAKTLEASKANIQRLRAELESETGIAQTALRRIQELAGSLNGSVTETKPTRTTGEAGTGKGGRTGGQRELIVAFVKGKDEPQGAELIAAHLGKSGKLASVRQTLTQMVSGGTLASFKKDGAGFRLPKKGERGGLYGLPT